MDELIAQMDILQTPETLTDEEMQILNDAAGQQTTADTVSTSPLAIILPKASIACFASSPSATKRKR